MPAVRILFAAALAVLAPARDEFGTRLAELASPRADERAAAERWLQAHLAPERYAEVAAAALAGDAEVRGRLQRVLGSDARHLELALGLCAEAEPELARLGRDAVRAGLALRSPQLGDLALRGKNLEELLARVATFSPPRFLRVSARTSLEEVVEQLELAGELPLGVTIDTDVATRTLRREEVTFTGPWDDLLLSLSGALGVTVECHGLAIESAQPDPAGAFLRLRAEADVQGTGIDALTSWLVELATSRDEPARARAARNLASSGSAPALEWMDRLARKGDRAALEGCLRAAAQGRVAPALTEAPLLEELLAATEAGGTASARVLAGLAHGPCSDAHGSPLAPRLLSGFGAASPRARWARLLVLERRGCAAAELGPVLAELLAAAGTPPALRLQALLCALSQPSSGTAPRVAGLSELFALPLDATELERLGRALTALGIAPPHADPASIPAAFGLRERINLLDAFLWSGARAEVADHVGALLDGTPARARTAAEALAASLEPWLARGAGPMVRESLSSAAAASAAREPAVLRVRLLLGLVPADELAAALARAGWTPESASADLALLGSLAALGGPPEIAGVARQRLLAELESALRTRRSFADSTPLVVALERAAQGLYAAGHDDEGERFARDVRKTFRLEPRAEITRRLERSLWPPAPGTATRDLARELARYEVPASL